MTRSEPLQRQDRNHHQALLLDLDGTLLDINVLEFIPLYIQALAPSFKEFADHAKFAGLLLGATRLMIESNDPVLTNEQVFYGEFCRRIGLTEQAVRQIFNRFYAEEFPKLRKWAKPRPQATAVLEAAQRRGLKIILATNPVFPLTAVEQRLSWGGLDSAEFDLITSIENMHFCKPRTDYYLEISRKISCRPERCLMAGNDVEEDLVASTVGMETFLVEGQIINSKGVDPVYHCRGSLGDLAAFLEKAAQAT